MTTGQPNSLQLRQLDVDLQQQEILRQITLDVLPGELFVVLGGAAAGKSTLLRAIAGLEPIRSGAVWIDDREVTHAAARKRRVALLLQDYPLWPHLRVAQNVAFALQRQGLARAEIRDRVERELAFVGLSEFGRHLPWQLSASQQQRVALARTLVAGAQIQLLDEPFSAQQAQLRERLLGVLRRRQQQSGITTVLATQERSEALQIADRIALIHEGVLQQSGTPMELYDRPCNRHVAQYLGGVNLIDGEIEHAGEQTLFRAANGIVLPLFDQPLRRARTGAAMFRPHDLRLVGRDEPPFGDQIRFNGRIEQTEFRGDTLRYCIDLAGHTLWLDLARGDNDFTLHIGDQVVLGLDPARIRILEH